jgi:drug/metabolite transporter (DMT)-like permease
MALPLSDPDRIYRPVLAALWAFGAVMSFTAMAVAGREAGRVLDTFEIMTYRSLIGLAIVAGVVVARRRTAEIRTNRLGLHLIRNLFHFGGQNLWLFALTVIPLAQLAALEFSYPIWVALFAPLVLGERLGPRRLFAVALGFVGILIIVRPGIVPLGPGTLAALCCAFGFAGAAIATRKLTADQSTLCVLFWLTSMQAVMGLATAGYDGQMAWPSLAVLPFVVVVGLTGLAAHFCLTTALSIAPATLVIPVEFLRLPATVLVGAFVYLEGFDPLVVLGSAVILAANLLNLWQPRNAASEKTMT